MTETSYTRAKERAGTHVRVDLILTPDEANFVIDWLERIDTEPVDDGDRPIHDHLVNYLYRVCDSVREPR